MELKVGDKVKIETSSGELVPHVGKTGTISELFRWYESDCALVKMADNSEDEFYLLHLTKIA